MALYKKGRRESLSKVRHESVTPYKPFIPEINESFKPKVSNLPEFLANGLKEMNLTLSALQQQQLLHYVDLIIKWNRAYNLTSVREPQDILIRHIFDSLSAAPYVEGKRVVDVGSGAGLPGVPLALMFPDRQFTLIDSNGKKARFLFHVVHSLRLNNLQVINERVEGFQKNHVADKQHPFLKFDTVISRAYTSIREMLFATEHLCAADGVFIAMKGVYPLTEIHELPEGFTVVNAYPVTVPHLEAERHILTMKMA